MLQIQLQVRETIDRPRSIDLPVNTALFDRHPCISQSIRDSLDRFLLTLCVLAVPAGVGVAQAQIVPDATLGEERSIVSPTNTGVQIDGGALRGENLFHSFEEFSVPTNSEAFFNNHSAVQNIFSRVTGGSISNIDGLLRANGTANLFLLNPNGIIFGANARLDLGGSFFATTADSFWFANGLAFNAANPENSPALLSVNVPLGVQFGRNPGNILVRGAGIDFSESDEQQSSATSIDRAIQFQTDLLESPTGLRVEMGETLALVGGTLELEGGLLKTPSGRIELGSVGTNARVAIESLNRGWQLDYTEVTNRRNIDFDRAAIAIASGEGRGAIRIRGGNVTLSGNASIVANPLNRGNGMGIDLNVEQLNVREGSRITVSTWGMGDGGNLNVTAVRDIELSGEASRLQANTLGAGHAGNITIETTRLSVLEGAQIASRTSSAGNGGTVTAEALDRAIFEGRASDGERSGIFSSVDVFATGNAGDIVVRAGTVWVSGGAVLSSRTFGRGNAGTVRVEARDAARFDGSVPNNFPSGAFTSTELFAAGHAGNVEVRARTVSVTNGAQLDSSTLAQGNAGTVIVEAIEAVFEGTDPNGFASGAFTVVTEDSTGDAGNILVRANTIDITDGATLSSTTFGRGNAGTVTVEADLVTLDRGRIGSFADESSQGNAGGVEIAADRISLIRGSEIVTSTEVAVVESTAGDVVLQAESIQLADGATIAANTQSRGGNVRLDSHATILQRGSNLQTNAEGNFPGGNISIDTGVLAALDNSDLTANARNAAGGRVVINAQGIFGTQFRNAQTPDSDITATSALGPSFSGTVELNTPDIDTASGLVDLSANPVDVASILNTDPCAAGRDSEFYITGRGGLPQIPDVIFPTTATWVDLRDVEDVEEMEMSDDRNSVTLPVMSPVVEARDWYVNTEGQVVLVANTAPENLGFLQGQPTSCLPRN
ncbi:MAG: S-layer family protein [Cyanobacteria bacterium SID2]|nr:S-layer family protein [Cyanobacteria bacterium SID2]